MADSNGRIRIEIGFQSGQGDSALVSEEQLAELEHRVKAREDHVVEIDGEDGRLLVVIPQVAYVRQASRETRIGFAGGL